MYDALVEKQRRAIKKATLGNTLNLQFKEKLFGPLIVYLIDKVDTENYTLVLGTKEDPVTIDLFEAGKKGVWGEEHRGGI